VKNNKIIWFHLTIYKKKEEISRKGGNFRVRLLFLVLLDEALMDVRNHTTSGDGGFDQSVQFFITSNC
jgi:hypothetical protein